MSGRKPAPRKRTPRRKTGVQLGIQNVHIMVLMGASKIFAERGVDAVSVEDILVAANVSRRTFYKAYKNKADVLSALYRLGTDRLIEACRRAVAEERDLTRQVERFVDAHVRNARDFGRLMFVLGGEAARQESVLHPRRMETHARLADLLRSDAELRGADDLLLRGLLLALEGVMRIVLEQCDEGRKVDDASIERARRVMMRIASSALASHGGGVAPAPVASS